MPHDPNEPPADEWLSLRGIARTMGISVSAATRLALADKLAVRRLPGLAPRYSKKSALALAERSTHVPAAD